MESSLKGRGTNRQKGFSRERVVLVSRTADLGKGRKGGIQCVRLGTDVHFGKEERKTPIQGGKIHSAKGASREGSLRESDRPGT